VQPLPSGHRYRVSLIDFLLSDPCSNGAIRVVIEGTLEQVRF
jgi:hypothetical protein